MRSLSSVLLVSAERYHSLDQARDDFVVGQLAEVLREVAERRDAPGSRGPASKRGAYRVREGVREGGRERGPQPRDRS